MLTWLSTFFFFYMELPYILLPLSVPLSIPFHVENWESIKLEMTGIESKALAFEF